jgi:hypothetical protein
MKINVKKTKLIAISDAKTFDPVCYIKTQNEEIIESARDPIKILGFTFSGTPSVGAHVNSIVSKARRRYWVLRHLRRFGFDNQELLQVYMSLIRSVIEYCSVVYHSMLSQEMEKQLERVQSQALKIIYGFGFSYNDLLEKTGIEKLSDRRLKAIDKFTAKCIDGKFSGWFPKAATRRSARNPRPYVEKHARCDRLKDSPLYFMRRRLNDMYQI